ncbi:Riboflavin transporter MCH5 [Talaromyces pinophilus]|nr:Riboflavin transporter MCH5 [Talaromyces pinophilus]
MTTVTTVTTVREQPEELFTAELGENEPAVYATSFPEGGRESWLVAIGSWCSMTAALGMVNSVGVLEAFVSTNILTSSSTDSTGWIFGIYVFVSYFCGVQVGPIFDARGPRELMLVGTVFLLVGTFTLGLCTEYYQFILAFSILSGIGNSFLFTPAMGAISHWFDKRRGEASGFAFTGSGFGGVLFPLMIQSLLPRVGWAWSTRIVGFVFLLLCTLGVALCRSRLPRKRGAAASWRVMMPDLSIFSKDGTGAMAVTTAGVFLLEWAYFVPLTYLPSYYLTRQGLSDKAAVTGAAAFAYQLLAILNAVSCVGRYLIGHIADRAGRYNTMIVSNLICLVSVTSLWLPDALAESPPSKALLICFVVVFGFASGSNVSLMPVCIGQLCPIEDYGKYYASAYTVASVGCLTGIPIAGNLITATEGGRRGYWSLILFTGISYVAAFACFLWVRVRAKGWNIRAVW